MEETMRMRRWRGRGSAVKVALALAAALGFSVALVLAGCAHLAPVPTSCNPGRMTQAPGVVNAALQDCYACETAQACSTVGNQWCCREPMCSECATPPVNFWGASHPDAGVR